MPSISPVNIPIVSKLDPKGFAEARAQLQSLKQPGGGGGGASGAGGGEASIAQKLGLGQAAQSIAGASGLGGVTSALTGAAGPVAAIASVGVALYSMTQHAAAAAQATKHAANEMRVSLTFYSGMANAARRAGLEMGEVTEGFSRFAGKVQAAAGGDFGAAMFLRSAGMSQAEINVGAAAPESLLGRLDKSQRWAAFGSARAADAAYDAQRGGGGLFDASADSAYANAKMQTGLGNALANIGTGLYGTTDMLNVGGMRGAGQRLTNERLQEESRERLAKFMAAQQEGGAKLAPSLVSPAAMEQYLNEQRSGFIYSADDKQNQNFRRLAEIQAHEQRLNADAPLTRARQLATERISDSEGKQAAGGYSSELAAERDRANIRAQLNDQLRGVRSNRENLEADIASAGERWTTEGKRRDVGGPPTAEQTDIARSLGDKMADAVESMTRGGGPAGAYDINTAQGASMVMGAEYQMDQSQNTVRMVELLVKIAENTGRMTKDQGDAVIGNLGFRSADPISGIFGGK